MYSIALRKSLMVARIQYVRYFDVAVPLIKTEFEDITQCSEIFGNVFQCSRRSNVQVLVEERRITFSNLSIFTKN